MMSCSKAHVSAEACVQNDAACNSCFGSTPFENVKNGIASAYRKTMAFEVPGTEMFCDESNRRVCTSLKQIDCCCQEEIEEHAKCIFEELGAAYGKGAPCELNTGCGEIQAEDAGAGEEILKFFDEHLTIIIAALVSILLICFCGFCERRIKRSQKEQAVNLQRDGLLNQGDCDIQKKKQIVDGIPPMKEDDTDHNESDLEVNYKSSSRNSSRQGDKSEVKSQTSIQLNQLEEGSMSAADETVAKSKSFQKESTIQPNEYDELEMLRIEREQMSEMIRNLKTGISVLENSQSEKAQQLEEQLQEAQEETALLRSENAASLELVSQVMNEKEDLLDRLQKVEGATLKLLRGKAKSFNSLQRYEN